MSELHRLLTIPSSATVHEAAGRSGALPSSIKPVNPSFCLRGPAFTVMCPAGDNLWLHRAVYAASPGDVLVVDVRGGEEFGYWGEILSEAAQVCRLAGLVIAGGVRDLVALGVVGFPVFATRICIRGTVKDPNSGGALGARLLIGDVTVSAGDFVVGDIDGVVVVPRGDSDRVLQLAQERDLHEEEVVRRLREGERTLDMYDLD